MQTRKGKEITDVRKSNGGAKSKNFGKSEKVKFIPITRTRSQKQKDEKHSSYQFLASGLSFCEKHMQKIT